MGLLNASLKSQQQSRDNTLILLHSIVQQFPCFRDESIYEGERVVFWKRAQILLAETWYGRTIRREFFVSPSPGPHFIPLIRHNHTRFYPMVLMGLLCLQTTE